jgi:hypothetical protein
MPKNMPCSLFAEALFQYQFSTMYGDKYRINKFNERKGKDEKDEKDCSVRVVGGNFIFLCWVR